MPKVAGDSAESQNENINIFDLLLILATRWRMIVCVCFLAGLIATGIASRQPNQYRATAKIISLQSQKIQPITLSAGASEMWVRMSLTQINMPILQDILKSERLISGLEKQFNTTLLPNQYRVKGTTNGVIEITVESNDPNRAAEIANAAVTELGSIAYDLHLVESPQITSSHEEKIVFAPTAIIKILQAAAAPSSKSNATLTQILFFVISIAFIASSIIAFMLEWLNNTKAENIKHWEQIKSALSSKGKGNG